MIQLMIFLGILLVLDILVILWCTGCIFDQLRKTRRKLFELKQVEDVTHSLTIDLCKEVTELKDSMKQKKN